nr:replication protein A 70 kDa DNA-binding subunit B-like isoform X1 [Ziziphus jujuba var. spinosa]
MTLMNDNMDTVILTMWNQFVNNECTQILNIMNRKPIIIGCRLKVSSYNGISLSTKSSSSFVIEPEIPQAAALSIWYNANAEKAMDKNKTEKRYDYTLH